MARHPTRRAARTCLHRGESACIGHCPDQSVDDRLVRTGFAVIPALCLGLASLLLRSDDNLASVFCSGSSPWELDSRPPLLSFAASCLQGEPTGGSRLRNRPVESLSSSPSSSLCLLSGPGGCPSVPLTPSQTLPGLALANLRPTRWVGRSLVLWGRGRPSVSGWLSTAASARRRLSCDAGAGGLHDPCTPWPPLGGLRCPASAPATLLQRCLGSSYDAGGTVRRRVPAALVAAVLVVLLLYGGFKDCRCWPIASVAGPRARLAIAGDAPPRLPNPHDNGTTRRRVLR